MKWIKGHGIIRVDDGVRISITGDICKYYQWFIRREWWDTKKTQLPAHGAHITILNPKIVPIKPEYSFVLGAFRNKLVEFEYCPEDIQWGRVNFWIPARCHIIGRIRNLLKIKTYGCDKGPHLTICNNKFNNDKKVV